MAHICIKPTHTQMLTPEESIKCQNEIGADIMMQVNLLNPLYLC
jgi:queuine/archaeosine tRNA-ribosyltransferase